MRDGKFPRPIKIGDRAVGFVESELDELIEQRIAVRDGDQ
jgi:prophage regulatory protein